MAWKAKGEKAGFATSSTSNLSYLTEPPSFTSISDPNVVVAFKNLLKSHSNTKVKGLEDLLAYTRAQPHGKDGVEDSVIEAWVQVYPRLSIDDTRRVRQLSHLTQLTLLLSAKKRMERFIPQIVGPWLAGMYDRDKMVSQAASAGLSNFLTTPDKVKKFWKKCRGQLLEYVIDALLETPGTLSDERCTSKEDAAAKFARVKTGTLGLIGGVMENAPEDLQNDDKFAEALGVEGIWSGISDSDVGVRKATCQLVTRCLGSSLLLLDDHLPALKTKFVTSGLKASHQGSATVFVTTLRALAARYPDIWTQVEGKKDRKASSLAAFISKGSQLGAPDFWQELASLIIFLPGDFVDVKWATRFLAAIRTGIVNKDEPRNNRDCGWSAYLAVAKHFVYVLDDVSDRTALVRENILPLFEAYLFAAETKAEWQLPLTSLPALASLYILASSIASPDLAILFESHANRLVERVLASSPEVCSKYEASQTALGLDGKRWLSLIAAIHKQNRDLSQQNQKTDITEQPAQMVLRRCAETLRQRNFNPFGAAAFLEFSGLETPFLWENTAAEAPAFLESITSDELALAIPSRSSSHLLHCFRILSTLPSQRQRYESIWSAWTSWLIMMPGNDARVSTISALLCQPPSPSIAQSSTSLQKFLLSTGTELIEGTGNMHWELLETAIRTDILSDDTISQLTRDAITALGPGNSSQAHNLSSPLRLLSLAAPRASKVVSLTLEEQTELVAVLLQLSEISGEATQNKISSVGQLLVSEDARSLAVVNVVKSQIENVTPSSIEPASLSQQALQTLKSPNVQVEDLFPAPRTWMASLTFVFQDGVNPASAGDSPLASAYYLIPPPTSPLNSPVPRDRVGRSTPTRMALYIIELLKLDPTILERLSHSLQVETLFFLSLICKITEGQLASGDPHKLWNDISSCGQEDEAKSLCLSIRTMRRKALSRCDKLSTAIPVAVRTMCLDSARDLTPFALYSAEVLADLAGLVDYLPSDETAGGVHAGLEVWKATPSTVLAALGIIHLCSPIYTKKPPQFIVNLVNKLISDVAVAKADAENTTMVLVLLDACLGLFDDGKVPVANNRIVFAVRQMTSWVNELDKVGPYCAAEICRSLQRLLPMIKDVYGPHWERALELCFMIWEKALDAPLGVTVASVHAAMVLYVELQRLEEPNDDLADAMAKNGERRSEALVSLVKIPRDNIRGTQISRLDTLLCQEIRKIPAARLGHANEFYGLLTSDVKPIQTIAFVSLDKILPAAQQEIALEASLDKKDVRLPDELLSLLLDAPTLEQYPDDEQLASFPAPVRGYLLAWLLLFNVLEAAPHRIKTDYIDHLVTEHCNVGPLVEFAFDVLGHTATPPNPINVYQKNITSDKIAKYSVVDADDFGSEFGMDWLLVHLLYRTIRHTPVLFRLWFHNSTLSSGLRASIASWTERWLSPLVITTILDEVAKWGEQQKAASTGDDDKPLHIKVNHKGNSLVAGYEVEDAFASMQINFGSSYPLEFVEVAEANRYGANAKQWGGWMWATRGVIIGTNGNIIDGLLAFKRNISLAMRGQEECAICYAIVASDRKLPEKPCKTCKHVYHSVCLFKWFETGNTNSCPLCRTPMVGVTGIRRPRGLDDTHMQ